MSNNESLNKDRIDRLFSETPPPPSPQSGQETSPEQETPPESVESPAMKWADQLQDEAASVPAKKERLGWDEYLNAIDRQEHLGFVFDQNDIAPLDQDSLDETEGLEVPLKVGDELLGALQLEGDQEWDPEDLNLLNSIAQQVAQHVENLRLLEQAEQYRAEAEEASRRLTHEGWEAYLSSSYAPTSGFIYDQNQVKPLESQVDFVEPTPNVLTHDLVVRDASIGQLVVAEPDEDVDTVSNLLTTISDRLSNHIENLRLLEETERSRQQLDRRANELETVAQVSTAAATILDPQALLQSVVDLTRYSFSLYHSSVYLLNEERDALELIAASGKIGQQMLAEGHVIQLDQTSIVAKAARTRDVVIVEDTQADADFMPYELLPDTRSELAVPMIVADQLVGVFDVEADNPGRFTVEDTQTYMTLASQTAVALRNAQLYAEQMATVERLQELDNMKSAFLANMSHELRTPLNSILGFTQVILEGLDGPLTDDMQMDLELIEKNGKHLLNLINDVLDMARIEAGRVSFYIESVNIGVLMDDVLRTNSSMAREKSIELKLVNNLAKDQMVMADSVRMRQVMINVVGNSLKFTEKGSITVTMDQTEDRIQIRVKDTGIGIPPSKLENIFEAFSQVDTSTTRKVGGTGLGLPISRRLIEMHNGRMWAESTGVNGEGTTMVVEIPIKGPDKQPTES